MSNYECIKTKFSHVDYYIKNAIVQKNVRGNLINKCKNILTTAYFSVVNRFRLFNCTYFIW